MDKHLHIVTHDIPWPADYGGVFDLFYKVKALHALRIKIHLHCYYSANRKEQAELNKYCETVDYYPRKEKLAGFSLNLPYIVKSRSDKRLLARLREDDHPILLEGIHCTYWLKKEQHKNRKVFVRLHNVEYRYYDQLAKYEKGFFKRLYFRYESSLLKKFEKAVADKAVFLTVSTEDASLYKREFNAGNIHFLPVFLPWNEVVVQPGKGLFCLYHGNLSVNENEKAATWLLDNVFRFLDIPFVVAGKNPSMDLQDNAGKQPHTCMVANPSEPEMFDLIKKAQVHVLPSFNKTGVKLKLLHALYNGRYCLVNEAGQEGADVTGLCSIAETPEAFRETLSALFEKEFTEQQAAERQLQLKRVYDNEKNARQLIAWIY